jgi:hypothetical protein
MIAFKTNNAIQRHLRQREKTEDVYNLSGVCQMKCEERPLKYTGQTGRKFKDRFKRHFQTMRTENPSSLYAQHKSNTGHLYSTIDQPMKILRIETTG